MGNLIKGIKNLFGREKGKSKKRRAPADPLQDALFDPLQAGDVKRTERMGRGGANVNKGMRKVRMNRGADVHGNRDGFFKAEANMATPMIGNSSIRDDWAAENADYNNQRRIARRDGLDVNAIVGPTPLEERDLHMGARAVASSRVDQVLGTGVLSDERFAEVRGKQGVLSMRAKGEQLRIDETYEEGRTGGTRQKYLDADFEHPEAQRTLSDLHVNDFLSGQVDRHAGNLFQDGKTGRFTGIDNDLSFGDTFNDRFAEGVPSGNAKNLTNLPELIDARTAARILAIDPLDYMTMLHGSEADHEHLDGSEVNAAVVRLEQLQDHIERIQARDGGADVDVTGRIVDEWDDETYQHAMASDQESYTQKFVRELDGVREGNDPDRFFR